MARARAPAGGITIGGRFYRPGVFIPSPPTEPEPIPEPAPLPVLDPNARIVDSLVQIGPPELGQLRIIRVHIEPGMSSADVLTEIEQIVEAWNQKYAAGAANRLIDFWRQA